MPIQLAAADAGGGVANLTITGSDVGTTNKVYWAPQYSAINGALNNIPWTFAGQRVGDGVVSATLIPGYYFFTALGTQGAVLGLSNAANRQLLDDGLSVHYQCLTTIQTKIQALNLTGLTSSKITVKWMPRNLEEVDTGAGIMISPYSAEGQPFSLNEADDVDYPCLVVMYDKQNQDYTQNLNRNLKWRERIFRLLRHKPLGPAGVDTVKVITQQVLERQFFGSNLFGSTLLFLATSRETRIP